MSPLASVFRGLIGLFLDDGSLALAVLAVVVLAGVARVVAPEFPLQAGAVLLFGCLGVLMANVVLAARR